MFGTRMKPLVLICSVAGVGLLAGCGGGWDSTAPPDMQSSNAMAAVQSFIATNGWNMQPNGPPFESDGRVSKNIGGLPWQRFNGQQFPAVTQSGILYVLTAPGWHHDLAGVAFNPQTNKFAATVRGFKPIGGHWYCWFQPEFQSHTFTQQYE
jgi:hypothetical protein